MPGPPDPDFEAFLSDPHTILLKYHGMFSFIVQFYVTSGLFAPEERDDMMQTVTLGVLERVNTIRAHYNGSTLFRTYIASIARNICLSHAAHEERTSPHLRRASVRGVDPEGAPSIDRYSLQRGRDIFRAVMLQFGSDGPKLRILLKLRYSLPFTREDILDWWPECGARELRVLLETFGEEYDGLQEKKKYALFSPFSHAAEGRVTGPDALRKWTFSRMKAIHRLMIRAFPESSFDDEDLRLLFEDYLSPFLLKE
jgi:hypothetical protein